MINGYLANGEEMDDRCLHLLFSANRWEAVKKMKALLDQGVHLIVDRYAFSGVAFSVAKGLDIEWCKSCDVGLPGPDVTLFMKLPPEQAATRGNYGIERYENIPFQNQVASAFMRLKDLTWNVIEADQGAETLAGEIEAIVFSVIDRVQNDRLPLREMWTR